MTVTKNERNTNRIYIRSTKEWVEVDKEYYDAYKTDVETFRDRQRKRGECECPRGKWYMCDCDCLICPFYKKDAFVSLDVTIDDEDDEKTMMDLLVDEVSLTPEEALMEKDELETLGRAIDQLCEEDRILIQMTLQGKQQTLIAEVLGLKRQSNVRYRKLRAIERLKAILA